MKVFISKYATTTGIEEKDVDEKCLRESGALSLAYYCRPGQWHKTREEAEAKAVLMAEARIKSCQKTIAKMELLIAKWGGG